MTAVDSKSEKCIEDILPLARLELYRDAVRRVCDENGSDCFTQQQLRDYFSRSKQEQHSQSGPSVSGTLRVIKRNRDPERNMDATLQIFSRYAEIELLEPGTYRWIPHIGKGPESVYVFYYPAYKELAKLKGQKRWPCKIGKTTGSVYERVIKHGTHLPERPRIAFVLKITESNLWEQLLHLILKSRLQAIAEAPGREWFNTTPNRILRIMRGLFESLATPGHAVPRPLLEVQFALGVMYRDGLCGPHNLVKAHAWMSLAAARGVNEAVKACRGLTERMSPAQIDEAEKVAAELSRQDDGPSLLERKPDQNDET